MNANDSAFLATLRDEFNAQPKPERFRTGRFMTYEAVMELLREREHAAATVKRIDTRIHIMLEAERGRVKPGDCIHCGKELCNDLGWCNSFKAADGVPLRDGNTPPPSHAHASSSETGQQENGNV